MRRFLLALLLASGAAQAAIEVIDDQGQTLRLAQPARRIVSLAPHVTEMLFAAGAGERVVGAVDYSDYPEAAQRIARVGGYTRIDLEAVAALRPDLVIGWQSGNREGDLARLQALGIPVYLSEPRNLEDVARNLERLGQLAGSEPAAAALSAKFSAADRVGTGASGKSAAVPRWRPRHHPHLGGGRDSSRECRRVRRCWRSGSRPLRASPRFFLAPPSSE